MEFPLRLLSWVLLVATAAVQAWVELPKFRQMKLLYPGYHMHGGQYKDSEVLDMVGGDHEALHSHDTASLRMSYALNRYGGRHAIGTEPVFLSKRGRDSITGHGDQEYIFRNTAFGPFLAARYGNPVVAKPDLQDHTQTMAPFRGKQGILRLVSYHRHAGGHVALWDCDHFHHSRDWTTESQIISVEFWETPDSYCPPARSTPVPKLVPIDPADLEIMERHNFNTGSQHDTPRTSEHRGQGTSEHRGQGHRFRHHRQEGRLSPKFRNLWMQR